MQHRPACNPGAGQEGGALRRDLSNPNSLQVIGGPGIALSVVGLEAQMTVVGDVQSNGRRDSTRGQWVHWGKQKQERNRPLLLRPPTIGKKDKLASQCDDEATHPRITTRTRF